MRATRQVTMSFNNGQYLFSLYVTPKEIKISCPQNTQRFISIEGKEINISAGEGLKRVDISTFLPKDQRMGIVNTGFTPPDEIIRLLKLWQSTRKPMRLVISKTDVNDAFLIEDFSQTFYEGDEEVKIAVSLTEYRFVKTPAISHGSDGSRLSEREITKAVPKTHTVKAGDTLWAISKLYYGTPYKWQEIQSKNGISDVRKLKIGAVIEL